MSKFDELVNGMTKFARIRILVLCLLLTVCSVYVGGSVATAETQVQNGVVIGDGVRVRKTPGRLISLPET